MSKITLYIKQAWMMIRQNKLFSGIYISGTGLSIALTMTLFVILYIKFAPLYPEYKRDRTLIINSVLKTPKDTTSSNFWQSTPNYFLVDMIRQLPSVDAVTGIVSDWNQSTIEASTEHASAPIILKHTDADYWRVYDFEFIDGTPYSDADVQSKTRCVVVSQSCAKRLFMTNAVIGRIIYISGSEYKIVGVVRDVASVMDSKTAADAWAPFTTTDYTNTTSDLRGDCQIAITAKNVDEIEVVKSEIGEMIHKYNQQDKLYNHKILGPDVFWLSQFRVGRILDAKKVFIEYGCILFALLMIPALNLSGMISSRMNKRLPELGIRKTYGATNSQLLAQILWENFLLTVMGGLVGIILCYVILVCGSGWITNIMSDGITKSVQLLSDNLSIEMLFNWWVFVAVLAISLILNIVSALIPATVSLRQTIINSLNLKQ